MRGDSRDRPLFPPTFLRGCHTGLVWRFVFWLARNADRRVREAAGSRQRKNRERDRHRLAGYIYDEAVVLPW